MSLRRFFFVILCAIHFYRKFCLMGNSVVNQNYIWLSNEEIQSAQTRRLYYSLCLILYLLQSVNPNTKFREHFRQLLEDYPVVKLGYMGFPKDWEQHPLWAGKISCKIQK